MGQKIDINKLRLTGQGQRLNYNAPAQRIEDKFEPAAEEAPVYQHNFFFGKNEGFYPGLRQLNVMPGDTLFGILTRQGFKAREITAQNLIEVTAQLNGIEAKEVLRVGQPLLVPGREFLQSMAS